jgi:regulator of protease activity HflC (stomatin/prohibitin superfamily)
MSLITCIVTSPISRGGVRTEVGKEIDLTPTEFERLEKLGCVEVAAAHRIRAEAEAKAKAVAEEARTQALAEAEKAKAEADQAAKNERAKAEALAKTDVDDLDTKGLRKLAHTLGFSNRVDWKRPLDEQRTQVRRLAESR